MNHNLVSNKPIRVKFPPQEDSEADTSGVSPLSEPSSKFENSLQSSCHFPAPFSTVYISSMPSKGTIIVIQLMFLGINLMFWSPNKNFIK